MYRQLKQQIIGIFDTLYEAHKEIETQVANNSIEDAIAILKDCQDAAIQIGNTIEESEKNKVKTIELLEDYCEELYSVSIDISNNIVNNISERLDNSLGLADESLKKDIAVINKVLMIAYFYPPLAGSGVYRSIKFSKYLSLYNWNATVISTDRPPEGWDFSDQSLVNEIPSDVTVYRLPDKMSHGGTIEFDSKLINNVYSFLSDVLCKDKETSVLVDKMSKTQDGLKFLLTFPDNSLLWSYDVTQFIENHLNITDYDVIYTTAGPYSAHLIGAYMKNKYGISWIADYRDQWSANPLIENKDNVVYKLLLQLEKNLLGIANHNITVSPSARMDYIKRLHVPEDKISVITNGYDEADFKDISYPSTRNEKFTLTYSGILYMQARTLKPVIIALNQLCKENLIAHDKICIQVIGTMNQMNDDLIKSYGFDKNFVFRGYLPHGETLRYNINSDILLLLVGDTAVHKSSITGKIFDYLRSCRPILALVPEDSDAGDIIQKTGHGLPFHFNEISKIKSFILDEYRKWEANVISVNCDTSSIKEYDRKVLTQKLTDIFNQNIWQNGRFSEIPASVYDNAYKHSIEYNRHYTDSIYYSSWKTAIGYLYLTDRNISILEIGCGPGQFAAMLFDNGFNNYTGFDYAKDGIAIAKRNNPQNSDKFYVDDAFTTDLLDKKYDLVICFEVLEHIKKDLELLERIASGTKLLLSVPNFNDPNHVRYFNSAQEVRSRYENIVNIFDVQTSVINEPYRLYYIIGEKR